GCRRPRLHRQGHPPRRPRPRPRQRRRPLGPSHQKIRSDCFHPALTRRGGRARRPSMPTAQPGLLAVTGLPAYPNAAPILIATKWAVPSAAQMPSAAPPAPRRRRKQRKRLRHNPRPSVRTFQRDSSFASRAVSIILVLGKQVQFERSAVSVPAVYIRFGPWKLFLVVACVLASPAAFAQGGPPYYTNDPGTPGNHYWEINLGYMPFLYTNQSLTHTPDVDINFGLGDRMQLTFENAWLRVVNPSSTPKYGLGQDQLGVKWRFYDNKESGFAISVFPQLSLNNPDDSVARGITPRCSSLIIPVEFS